jgi:rubredoxin
MLRRLVCLDCEHEFDEEDAEPFDGVDSLGEALASVASLEELRSGELVLVECFCPNCGSDDLEDVQNLEAIAEMKGGH